MLQEADMITDGNREGSFSSGEHIHSVSTDFTFTNQKITTEDKEINMTRQKFVVTVTQDSAEYITTEDMNEVLSAGMMAVFGPTQLVDVRVNVEEDKEARDD